MFPAPAGINRGQLTTVMANDCVPRASGDKPALGNVPTGKQQCSPRQRG
ncbi:TPA: hypothetical protein H2X82_000111 [Salmonella enterica]|nr:hypothetical protein [Salmonella enterica]